jgi:predicted DCC family thiol-disulfide oxidoreductase YuxK
VLVEEGQHYIKSDAILRIASRLALPMPLVAAALMPFPYFIKDTFYDQVGPETQPDNQSIIAATSSNSRLSSRMRAVRGGGYHGYPVWSPWPARFRSITFAQL